VNNFTKFKVLSLDMKYKKVPLTAVRRLSIYARTLSDLENRGRETVSSEELGLDANIPSTQVRKDLAYFGQFGTRGKGYSVKELNRKLREILGLDRSWNVALVGAGNLGKALFSYPGFRRQGFHIVAVFDNDPAKIDKEWKGLKIQHIKKLPEIVKEKKISIGIIAVPSSAAQEVAETMCRAGIKAILNFAPKRLFLPPECKQGTVDLAIELENLSYFLTK